MIWREVTDALRPVRGRRGRADAPVQHGTRRGLAPTYSDMASGPGEKRKRDAVEALSDVAGSFRCSITSSLVLDPVTTCDGQLYEKTAIQEWLRTHSTSPNTGNRLESKTLTPSPAVKTAVERLVFSGCLDPEETREWLLRKAVALLDKGEAAEAQPLLERALAEGEAAAGYHLGRLLIERAATAGVPDAIAAVAKLQGETPPAAQPIRSIDEVEVGDFVRLLPEAQVEAAFDAHAARHGDLEWNCWSGIVQESMRAACGGPPVEVVETDANDDSIEVSLENDHGPLPAWFPMAALTLDRRGPSR